MWKLIFVYLLLFCVGRDLLRKDAVEATLSQKQIAQAVRMRRGKTESDEMCTVSSKPYYSLGHVNVSP